MCFVHSWKVGLEAIWRVAWLSHSNLTNLEETPKSYRSLANQSISLATLAIALYSTSTKDLATVGCFFDFHNIKLSPRNMQ